MKSISQSSLSYSGNAIVKIQRGDKFFTIDLHNQGTENLGLFFSKSLAGYFSKNDCPRWFNFEYKDSAGKWISLLRTYVPLTGATYITDSEKFDVNTIGQVRFIAVLQQNLIRPTTMSGFPLRFSMYDDNGSKKLLAYIQGDPQNNTKTYEGLNNTYTAVSGGQDAIVEWIMNINNN